MGNAITHVRQGATKRIYVRPEKVAKKIKKIRRVLGYPDVVRCKVCWKKLALDEAVLVGGGGNQGHRDFFMCEDHR
jgi:hypothetical protein